MNCDRIAPWYRWLEYFAFGPALTQRRSAFISEVRDARRVLILGDGDGRFTTAFLRENNIADVDSVELSARMLKLSAARLRRHSLESSRIRLCLGDARGIPLAGPYDLIVTHFFLDCFTDSELDALVARITAAATPQARWLVSEFQVPASGWRRIAGALFIRMLYALFRTTTGLQTKRLPAYATTLRSHGFDRLHRIPALGGLLVSELWRRHENIRSPTESSTRT
jgi:SAM-dependent methyltransferase